MSLRLRFSLLGLLSVFTFVSCQKKDSSTSVPASPQSIPAGSAIRDLRDFPGTVFAVSYTSSTVRVDQSAWQHSLKSVSSDGDVLVFDDPDSHLSSLTEGSTLFLENLAVRKVLATASKDGHLVVKTDHAGITDLIQNGDIRWKVPVKFSTLLASAPAPIPPQSWATRLSPEGVVYAAGIAINLSGKLDGWDYKINVTPSSNRLDTFFAVHKELDGLIVNFDAKGFLKDFVSSADMHVQDASLENFNYDASGLNGELNVNYEGGRGTGSTAGMDTPNIKLPTLAKVPFPVGGIPFVVTVNANLILKPGFGGKNETMKGSFKVSYNGDEGISVKGGQASASGNISGDGSIGNVLSMSIAPHAILIGMAAPKITLSLGTDSVVDTLTSALPSALADTLSDIFSKTDPGKWAKKKMEASFKTNASASVQNVAVMTVTAAGAASMVPCKLSRLTLTYKTGADAYLLGQKIGDKEVILFKKDIVIREPDINACGDK